MLMIFLVLLTVIIIFFFTIIIWENISKQLADGYHYEYYKNIKV